jgi:hypothetical protein
MFTFMDALLKERRLLTVLLIGGLLLRLFFCMYDIVRLTQICLADDAYYYFQIARNIAHGYGATADRLHQTNGFHPLYMALLVPIFKVFGGDKVLPVRIALCTLSLFNTFTAVFVYRILKRLCSPGAALLGAGFYLFNPAAVFTCLTGVEAALSTFFIAAAADRLVIMHTKEDTRCADMALLGAFLGLALLARTDSILFCGWVALDQCIVLVRRKRPLLHFIVCVVIIAAIISPWLLWNVAAFHTFEQNSGKMLHFLNREIIRILYPGQYGAVFINFFLAALLTCWSYFSECFVPFVTSEILKGVIALFVCVLCFLGVRRALCLRRYLRSMYPLFATVLTVFTFYSWYFLYAQRWYFMSSFFVGALVWGPALWYAQQLFSSLPAAAFLRRLLPLASGAIVIVCLFWTYCITIDRGYNPWQALYIRAGQFIDERVPVGTRIGAFNSGTISYFAPHHRVINLDGLVNADIYEVFQKRTLMEYLWGEKIELLVDHNSALNKFGLFSAVPLGNNLALVYRFRAHWWGLDDMLLLKVTPPLLQFRMR